MDVQITPEPTEDERRAILEALRLECAELAEPTPWRRVGLGAGDDEDDDYAIAPRRQSRGATRA